MNRTDPYQFCFPGISTPSPKISAMKQNVGAADKMIRIFIAIVCSVLFITGVVSGTLGYVVLAAGAVMLGTALINFCPLYRLLGINTCRR